MWLDRRLLSRAAVGMLLVAIGVSLGVGTARAEVDLAADPASALQPEKKYAPRVYWWWPGGSLDRDELDRELEAIAKAGFRGVQHTLIRKVNQWWTAEHRATMEHAVRKATELGLTFDANLGPGWPMTARVANDESKRLSMQEAVVSSMNVVGPSTFVGRVPARDDTGLRRRSLVAVTAAQPVIQNASTFDPIGGRSTPARIMLRPETAVDLTASVRGGVIRWQVPPGRWKLFGVWSRVTGDRANGDVSSFIVSDLFQPQNLGVPLGDFTGQLGPLVIDHFSRRATEATLAEYDRAIFGGGLAALMARNGGSVYDNSLELKPGTFFSGGIDTQQCACTGRFWTPDFLTAFRKQHGYDLTRFLPGVFIPFVFADGGETRLRRDYFATLQALLIDGHYGPIHAWAKRHGLTTRAQGYDLTGSDKTRVATAIELPESESLGGGDNGATVRPGSRQARAVRDHYRDIVSGAHLSGAREISLEAGASPQGEQAMRPVDYQAIANRGFASGMTSMVLHGFAYRTYRDGYQSWTWPGWSVFNVIFAQSWNQTLPQFAHWSGVTTAWSRIGAALQSGRPVVDLTVINEQTGRTKINGGAIYGTPDTKHALDETSLVWDRIDDASFADLPAPVDGRLLPNGPGYRAVIVDDQAALSAGAAERLLATAEGGVPVVLKGRVADRGISYAQPAAEDARVGAAMHRLLTLPNVRRVQRGAELVDALTSLGIGPDLQANGLPLVAQHRRTAGGHVWFLLNDSSRDITGDVTFAATGTPSAIDPWSGHAQRLSTTRTHDGRTTLPLSLAPGQTLLVAFSERATPATAAPTTQIPVQVTSAQRSAPKTVVGPWALDVRTTSPSGNGRITLTLPHLRDWRTMRQLRAASGTATYTTTVDVPADWLADGRGVLLDTGTVGGTIQTEINGRPTPLPTYPDGPRDVTAYLRAGPNTLSMEVATSLINQLRARALSGDLRYALFALQRAQPHGLLGPVSLTPYRVNAQ